MRPRDVTYSATVELPEWLYSLRRQIGDGGAQAPPETLGAVTALAELRAVAEATVTGPGRPESKPDRQSLRDDVEAALDALGPTVTGELASSRRLFQVELDQIDARLSAGGIRRLLSSLRAFEGRLTDRRVTRAAWDDVCAAFLSNEWAETCELRLLQLRELVEHRGHDWKRMEQRLVGVINDDRVYLQGVDRTAVDTNDPATRRAGLPLDTRLAIAREVVGETAPTGDVTVWVIFENAWLEQGHFHLGPIQFFDGSLWPDSIRAGNVPGGPILAPPELDEPRWEDAFGGLPEKDFVLARTQLGEGKLAGMRERARQLAQDAINSALHSSEWVLMNGAASYLHGSGWGWNRFTAADAFKRHRSPARNSETSRALAQLDARFLEALLQGDPVALDAADHVRWDSAADQVPDIAQRLALRIRVLDRALATAGGGGHKEHWRAATERLLKASWVEHELGSWVIDATLAIIDSHPGRWHAYSSEPARVYRALKDELAPSDGSWLKFHPDAAMRRLPELADDHPPGSMERRLLDELIERTRTGTDVANWLDELDERFNRLLKRTVRQRNQILHGTSTVPTVLKTIEPFVRQLSSRVIGYTVHSTARRETAIEALEAYRYAAAQRRSRLEAKDGVPSEILFRVDSAEEDG